MRQDISPLSQNSISVLLPWRNWFWLERFVEHINDEEINETWAIVTAHIHRDYHWWLRHNWAEETADVVAAEEISAISDPERPPLTDIATDT